MRVKSYMQAHPQGHRQEPPLMNPGQQGTKQHQGTVESPGPRMLWRAGLVEKVDGSHRIHAALAQAEPRIVVRIDEHAPRHQAERASAGPRAEQRRTHRGEY